MSVNVDDLFQVTVVPVTQTEQYFARMEMSNELLYMRVNSKMLKTRTAKPSVPVELLNTQHSTSDSLNL